MPFDQLIFVPNSPEVGGSEEISLAVGEVA
ncbi:hypothetical protein U2A4042140067 [Corynebacterium striatum]|nr:hypothetical protein U2A4042140067 [Corynebacterium striatum]